MQALTWRNLRDHSSRCHPARIPDVKVVKPVSATMDFLRNDRMDCRNDDCCAGADAAVTAQRSGVLGAMHGK